MNIAVFLPEYHAERIQEQLPKRKNVRYEAYKYKSLEQLSSLFQGCQHMVDGYLFSGLLSYSHIMNEFKQLDKPYLYLKLTDAEFYKKLLMIKLDHPNLDFSKVFIDFYEESESIKSFIQELDPVHRPYVPDQAIDISHSIYEMGIDYHVKLHREGLVDLSFTRLVNILPELEKQEIPHVYFDISKESVEKQVTQLIESIHMQKLRDNQIVIGYLQFQAKQASLLESDRLFMHSLLLKYQHFHRHLLTIDRLEDCFQLTTNSSLLNQMTKQYTTCHLNGFLSEKFDASVHIGWGLGENYNQAEINAKRALENSINHVLSSTFICQENQQLIGPLRQQAADESTPKANWIDQANLAKLREQLDMSEDRFNKVILAFDEVQMAELTSAAFAEILKISVRSANRILAEAEKNSLVTSSFERSTGLQGRPKKIYRLNKDRFIHDD